MKIEILCSDGSPLGVTETTIQGDTFRVGVGGSELAMLTMCRLWHDAGHEVILYNNPWAANLSVFEQRAIASFSPNANRDVLVIFRSPNARAIPAKGKKVWWSCDQFTIGDFKHFSSFVDKIVCISPFHANYFETVYGIDLENIVVIDLPIRVQEIESLSKEKVRNRMIFTSVPNRGLQNLWRMYPKIKKYIPDVSMVITSDYRLWGAGEMNQHHKGKWMVHDNVNFMGALHRQEYLEELAKAELMLYPGNYDELFCISVAEAQVAGVVCITTAKGALGTTNLGNIFYLDGDDPHNDVHFVDRAVEILSRPEELALSRELIREVSTERFSPDTILRQWNKNIFEDNSK